MVKVKVVEIDTTHNSIIAKVWDSDLKKTIDDYPAVAIDISLIDFSKNIETQLSKLLEAHLQYLKNIETDIPKKHLELVSNLLNKEIEVDVDSIPLPGNEELDYQTYKSNWENGL